MSAANDPVTPDDLPCRRCGNCERWVAWRGRAFGFCDVRPGVLPTYTRADVACDVNHGCAWRAKKEPA